MLREHNTKIRAVLKLTDFIIVAASFFLAYAARKQLDGMVAPVRPLSEYVFLLYVILPLWLVLFSINGVYKSIRTKSFFRVVLPLFKTTLGGAVVLMTILFIFRLEYISRALLIIFFMISGASLVALRVLILSFIQYIRKKGYNYRAVVIVGAGTRAQSYARSLEGHREWGVKIIGFIELEENDGANNPNVIGNIGQFNAIITSLMVDEVVFVMPRKWLDRIEEQILVCEQIGIKASIVADFYPNLIAKVSMEDVMGTPLIVFNPTHRLDELLAVKRVVDIVLSGAAFIMMLPLFAVVSVLTKASSPGPVFFRQERCGLNGRQFYVLKFRTMVDNADGLKGELAHLNEMSGPVFKIKKDPRVTPVGRFLRKYSLDELPQLINVLKGDMSLVGPRPPIPAEVEKYDVWQRRRLSVRPGITCFWQVSGRNNIGFDEWMKLDLQYIDNWSFKQDMRILLRTIPAVFRGSGV